MSGLVLDAVSPRVDIVSAISHVVVVPGFAFAWGLSVSILTFLADSLPDLTMTGKLRKRLSASFLSYRMTL